MSIIAIRKLTESEVTFALAIEPDQIDVRGNVMASGDDEADKADEDAIIERLQRGETEAWCVVIVRAEYEAADGQTFTGVAMLGGCSFAGASDAEVAGRELRQDALAGLNASILAARGVTFR